MCFAELRFRDMYDAEMKKLGNGVIHHFIEEAFLTIKEGIDLGPIKCRLQDCGTWLKMIISSLCYLKT